MVCLCVRGGVLLYTLRVAFKGSHKTQGCALFLFCVLFRGVLFERYPQEQTAGEALFALRPKPRPSGIGGRAGD